MHVLMSNFSWMSFNVFLALIAVLFGWLMKATTWKLLRIIYGAAWIIFLPNTLYLLTDIIHLFARIERVQGIIRVFFIFQYLLLLLLGVITYFAAVYPVEQVFIIKSIKWNRIVFMIIISLLVGFGMTLGRVERINSWNVLSNIPHVIHASAQVFTSTNLLLLMLLFTAMSIFIYLSLRTVVLKTGVVNIVRRR